MAAYGAASSLKITIERIRQSSRISLVPPSPQILQPAYEAMELLQKVLLKLDETSCSKIRTEVNALDERIKKAVWEFEDLLESHVTDQILPQLQSSGGDLSFSIDLQSLQDSVDCFIDRVMEMGMGYLTEVANMPDEEGEPISSRIDFGGINSKMVGLSDQFQEARDYLLAENEDEGNRYSLIGMAGVGKTTLAKKVFDDPSIRRHFELRAWVKVGRKCDSNETLRCILAQLDPNTHDQMLTQGEGDEKLVGLWEDKLKGKKCLVVLDDVWETRVMDNLPDKNVRILLTSRLRMISTPCQEVRLLNEEESKKLLGEKVFGDEGFPLHLEELGEKISKKCEGLPLLIVTVAELLSEAEKTPEYWTEVAKKHSSLFKAAYNQISEVLFPSYDYLPQYLKMLFLYLGCFPPESDFILHALIHQLSADAFLEPIEEQTFPDCLIECLLKLVGVYHLVLFSLDPVDSWFSTRKFCVHSCWQHLCRKQASKIKFLHVLQSCDDIIKDQRRLCAHYNTLFCLKQVYDSIKTDCASTARSLLCYGPYHQYPVPIHAMGFKLLGVLVALSVRFYQFPVEIVKLIGLHYVSLTCNGDLPASISNLFYLQTLIIRRHMNIKKRGAQSYMPAEIWNMQELKLIHVAGRDLPNPNSDATLDKLSGLVGVTAKSCTREVLKKIPNLKKLGIHVVLKPYDDDEDTYPLSCLGYISEELHNLQTLGYYVLNPEMNYESMIPLSMFPSSLTRLELSGLGCSWKHMNDIGSLLSNLEILKLLNYAFRGREWNIESGWFMKLKTLVIEDTDLVRWRPQHGSFPKLELLSIRHCYKLRQLDWTCDRSSITTIELVECNPLAIASANQLRPESLFTVMCYSSFLR